MAKLGFKHIQVPQRSPEWQAVRVGKVTASRLGDFTSFIRNGSSSAVRKSYLQELAYERALGVPFDHYVTPAMQAGIDNEDFVCEQYEQHTGSTVVKCGIFANEHFAASPDGLIGEEGMLEIKWVQAPKFAEIISTGEVPKNHWLQIQGQLLATARKWCDYVVGNGQTGKFVIIRVERDLECSNAIVESIKQYVEGEEYTDFENKVDLIDFSTSPPTTITSNEGDDTIWS